MANFIGDSNVLPCVIGTTKGTETTIKIGDLKLKLNNITTQTGIASALIRPEHIALNPKKITSALAGTIDKSTYIGSKVEYNISTAIGSVFAVAQSDKQEFEVGQPVFLKFPADKLNILSA